MSKPTGSEKVPLSLKLCRRKLLYFALLEATTGKHLHIWTQIFANMQRCESVFNDILPVGNEEKGASVDIFAKICEGDILGLFLRESKIEQEASAHSNFKAFENSKNWMSWFQTIIAL